MDAIGGRRGTRRLSVHLRELAWSCHEPCMALPRRVCPVWTSLRREGRVDTCHEGGLERTCLGRGHTFEEFSPVLAADHDGVDILHGQRIAVSEHGCRRTKLLGQRAESPTAIVVPDDAMLRGQVAVERVGERATLDRSDAEHAGSRFSARGNDLAGVTRPGEVLKLARRVQRVRDALHGGWTDFLAQRSKDAFGNTDAGNSPGADAPVGSEPLADWNEVLEISCPARRWAIGVSAGVVAVWNNVRMQEEQVNPLEPHAREALLETTQDVAFYLRCGRRAQSVLGLHANAGRQPALEGSPDDAFSLAVAIGRCHVEQCDAAFDRRTHGRNAFLTGGCSPELANAAASKGERTHWPQSTEHSF